MVLQFRKSLLCFSLGTSAISENVNCFLWTYILHFDDLFIKIKTFLEILEGYAPKVLYILKIIFIIKQGMPFNLMLAHGCLYIKYNIVIMMKDFNIFFRPILPFIIFIPNLICFQRELFFQKYFVFVHHLPFLIWIRVTLLWFWAFWDTVISFRQTHTQKITIFKKCCLKNIALLCSQLWKRLIYSSFEFNFYLWYS